MKIVRINFITSNRLEQENLRDQLADSRLKVNSPGDNLHPKFVCPLDNICSD